jgi:DNA-binding NtrC family response regulator
VKKLGAFNYLIKPCEIEQLMAKVLLATKKKRDHEEKIREARVREALSAHGLE